MSHQIKRIPPSRAPLRFRGLRSGSWLAAVVGFAGLCAAGAALAQPAVDGVAQAHSGTVQQSTRSAPTKTDANRATPQLLAQAATNPPAPTASSSSTASTGQLQEVIVTARYRAENLQSTPLSITPFTSAVLQQQRLTNVNQLGNEIPNAFFRQPTSNYGPTETIGLRGFTQTDFDFSFQPTVGFYIDDVYQGTLTGSSFDLVDVNRVEVLNGPQGTLFGMNTIGGAIRIITNKPKGTNTGSLEVTYGQHHRVEIVGIGDVSLIKNKLFMRVVANTRSQDGIGHYLDFTCEMRAQGQPASVYGTLPQTINPLQSQHCALGGLGGYNHQYARIMLRYLPTSGLELNFKAYYTKQADDPPLQTLLTPYGGPHDFGNNLYDATVVFPKFGMHYAGFVAGNSHFVSPSPWDNYATFGDVVLGQQYNPTQRLSEYGTDFTVDYTLPYSMQLKYIWGYRNYYTNWINDSDLLPFGLIQTNYHQGHRQFQNELRVSGTAFRGKLDWTIGGFYYDARDLEENTANFDAFNAFGLPNDFALIGFTTNNQSGFIHFNYHLTSKWAISGGWRITSQFQTSNYNDVLASTGAQILKLGPVDQSGSRGDWNGSISYQVTPTIYVYGEAASGFTLPGFNTRIETIGQLMEPVPGQEAVNYEIGAKTDWFNHRLRVNGTLFYEDYKSFLQLELATQCTPANDPNPGTPIFGLSFGAVCPAGTPLAGQPGFAPWFYYAAVPAYEPGADLEITAEPIDRLLVNFSGGWIEFHSKISDQSNPAYMNPSVRRQPEWNASGGIQYGINFSNGGTLTPRLDWRYQGYMTDGPVNVFQINPAFRIPGYSLFNASLTYTSASGRWDVSFRAQNLFNKFYWVQLGAADSMIIPGPTGVPSASNLYPAVGRVGTPGLPREWMMTVGMHF